MASDFSTEWELYVCDPSLLLCFFLSYEDIPSVMDPVYNLTWNDRGVAGEASGSFSLRFFLLILILDFTRKSRYGY